MIKIKYDFGDVNRIELHGHAGYAREGDDIVCAAVSGIFYALCGKLENQNKEYVYRDKPGDSYAECRGERDCFEMAIIGFMQIANTYPKNVKVEKGELKAPQA